MRRKIICITPRDWYPFDCSPDGTVEDNELEEITETKTPRGWPLLLKKLKGEEKRVWVMLIYNDKAKEEGHEPNPIISGFVHEKIYGNAVLAVDTRGSKKLTGFNPEAFEQIVNEWFGGF